MDTAAIKAETDEIKAGVASIKLKTDSIKLQTVLITMQTAVVKGILKDAGGWWNAKTNGILFLITASATKPTHLP